MKAQTQREAREGLARLRQKGVAARRKEESIREARKKAEEQAAKGGKVRLQRRSKSPRSGSPPVQTATRLPAHEAGRSPPRRGELVGGAQARKNTSEREAAFHS